MKSCVLRSRSKRAEDALRASEQVARGQVEALAQSLDVLALRLRRKIHWADADYYWPPLERAKRSLWLFDNSTDSLILRSSTSDGGNSSTGIRSIHSLRTPYSGKRTQ